MPRQQIVTLETAKLAREKGFDIETLFFWNSDKIPKLARGLGMTDAYIYFNWNNGLGKYQTIPKEITASAPDQTILHKWLREKYGFYLIPIPRADGNWAVNSMTVISEREVSIFKKINPLEVESIENWEPIICDNWEIITGPEFPTFETALEYLLFKALKQL